MYQALYRKWRPRSFDDVVGQEHVTETLKRQVMEGRLSHAYLFTGTRGTGKTTCAKILARAVNCENPVNGNPCNCCPSCRGIEDGSILDVAELDAASNNKVENVRSLLDEAVYTPATVKKRVYIVDEVHMLSPQAFNALLQILEEPPAHLMFILATTELQKIPATIKSRCQQFAFKRISADKISKRLQYVANEENLPLTADGATIIARLADGGLRDALSLLDQCAAVVNSTLDTDVVLATLGLAGNAETAAILEDAGRGDTASALNRMERLYAGGKEMTALANELSTLVRDLLIYRTAPKAADSLMTGGFDHETLRRLSTYFETTRLVQMLSMLQKTASDLSRSANRRTDMELCLVVLCNPYLDTTVSGLASRVARLEKGIVLPSPAESQQPQQGQGQGQGQVQPIQPAPQPARTVPPQIQPQPRPQAQAQVQSQVQRQPSQQSQPQPQMQAQSQAQPRPAQQQEQAQPQPQVQRPQQSPAVQKEPQAQPKPQQAQQVQQVQPQRKPEPRVQESAYMDEPPPPWDSEPDAPPPWESDEEAPPPWDDSEAPPPPEEEPMWEEEYPPARQQRAAASQPQTNFRQQQSAARQAQPQRQGQGQGQGQGTPAPQASHVTHTAKAPWPGWGSILPELKTLLPGGLYAFLNNAAMCRGQWDGNGVVLWTTNDAVESILKSNTDSLKAITEVVSRRMGIPCRVEVRKGTAPPDVPSGPAVAAVAVGTGSPNGGSSGSGENAGGGNSDGDSPADGEGDRPGSAGDPLMDFLSENPGVFDVE